MKKKLLIISSLYPNPSNPFRGIFVQEQAHFLANLYNVRVIAYEFPLTHSQTSFTDQDIDVDYIKFPAMKNFFPSSIATFPLFMRKTILRIIHDWKPDIIHVHDYAHIPGLYWLKQWLCRMDIPHYLTLHNLKSMPGTMNRSSTNWFYRCTLKKALTGWDCIFTVNSKLREIVKNYTKNCVVIGNGIHEIEAVESNEVEEVKKFIDGAEFSIISVGNLIKTKGFDHLIDAVYEINKEGIDCRVVIVGQGPEYEILNSLLKGKYLEEKIILIGAKSNRIVRSLYHCFDAFVLPSWSETFGIVYLEAMYAGLPVIGVVGQGLSGILIDGKEALFCDPQNTCSLTEKIRELIMNTDYRIQVADNGKKTVFEKYLLKDVMQKVLAQYK